MKQVQHDKTELISNAHDRHRLGQVENLADADELSDTLQREAEINAGHGDIGYAGLLVVSAPDPGSVDPGGRRGAAGRDPGRLRGPGAGRATDAGLRRRRPPTDPRVLTMHESSPDAPAHAGGFLPDDADRTGTPRRTGRHGGQAADQLVRDQQDRAAAAKAAEVAGARRPSTGPAPRRPGRNGPGRAAPAAALRLRKHRATTANLSHVYPFLADGGLGSAGIYVGRDSYSGASFCYCGFDLYNRRPRLVSNTNIMMVGNIGWGKTNTAMALAVRNLPFGRRIVVPGDPKDDWLRLAIALGGQGIRLGRGLPARLNPLDGGVKPAGQGPGRCGTPRCGPAGRSCSSPWSPPPPRRSHPLEPARRRRPRPGPGRRRRRGRHPDPAARRASSGQPRPGAGPARPGTTPSCCGTAGNPCTRCCPR